KLGGFHPFQYRIVAKNLPTSYAASGLPNGLSVNTETGLISGTPAQVGTFKTTISATNANGTSSVEVAITILPPLYPTGGTLTVTPDSPVLPGAALHAAADGWMDSDGPLTYEFFLDGASLGAGTTAAEINFDAPVVAGTHVLKVEVTDALGNSAD